MSNIKRIITSAFVILSFVACTADRFQGSGWSTPLVDEGNVYVATIDGELISVNIDSGSENWRAVSLDDEDRRFVAKAIYSKPFIYDDKTFIGTSAGKILGFNKQTGLDEVSLQDIEEKVLLSEENYGPMIVGNIVSHEDLIYVPASNGELLIFKYNKLEMFDPVCSYQVEEAIWNTPVYDELNQQIIFGSMDGNMYSINNQCNLNWEFDTKSSIVGSPILENNQIYFGTLNRKFYSINAKNGNLTWEFDDSKGWFWAAPVINTDIVYAPNLDGSIYALNKNTGQIKWKYETKSPIVSTPVVIEDFLIFVTKNGELLVIHKDSKRKLGTCNIDKKIYSSIEVYENKIFIQVSDGSLRGFNIKKNGNPDELWQKPFFTRENYDRNEEDWDPSC